MANRLSEQVTKKFGLKPTGIWEEKSLLVVEQACQDFCEAFHLGLPIHLCWMQKLEVRLEQIIYGGLTCRGLIKLNPDGLNPWTVVHEIGHAWDDASFCLFSLQMSCATRSSGPFPLLHYLDPADKRFWYRVGSPPPPCGVDQNFNRFEDFAEAVAAYVYPKEAFQRAIARGYPYGQYGYNHFRQTPRGRFIARLADSRFKTEMAPRM